MNLETQGTFANGFPFAIFVAAAGGVDWRLCRQVLGGVSTRLMSRG